MSAGLPQSSDEAVISATWPQNPGWPEIPVREASVIGSVVIPKRYGVGMSTQMTIRVDDDLAAFVDSAAAAGEGSRADVINNAIKREVRRRAAQRDAQIYGDLSEPASEEDAYSEWAAQNASRVWAELD